MARAAAAAALYDDALAWLDTAARECHVSLPFMYVTPAFDGLHTDPRYRAMGPVLGLPYADRSPTRNGGSRRRVRRG